MAHNLNNISTIIFDLGGVIINLDTFRTVESFAKLNPGLSRDILEHPVLLDYETGLLSDDEFRARVAEMIGDPLEDHRLDECWNAMILDIPGWRIDLLRTLRKNYTLMLLSNTNAIHIKKVEEEIRNHGLNSIEDLFDKAYYSHVMKKRKPNTDIFEQVIMENNLIPSETLFIDDNPHNIAGARAIGLQTIHLTDPNRLREIFHEQT